MLLVQDELARWTAQAGDPAFGCAQYEELIPVLDRVLGASHDYTLAARRRLAQLRTGQPIVDP